MEGEDLTSLDEDALRERLQTLVDEHRQLDDAVHALVANGVVDQLKIARLKKQKLRLKDEIMRVEELLTPDIIA